MEENQSKQNNPAMGYYPKDIYTHEKRGYSETAKKQEASPPPFSSILNNTATIQSLLNGENLNSLLFNNLIDAGQKNNLAMLSNLFTKTQNKHETASKKTNNTPYYEEL